MAKYLTEFSSSTAYNAAINTLDYPNVSVVSGTGVIYAETRPIMYAWNVTGTMCGNDEGEYDSCNLYDWETYQQSSDGGQTWTNVTPLQQRYGDLVEEQSSDCGCGGGDCEEGATWDWTNYTAYEDTMAVMNIYYSEIDSGGGDVVDITIVDSCDLSEIRIVITTTEDAETEEAHATATIYSGQTVLATDVPCGTEEDAINLYTYLDKSNIDSLHITNVTSDVEGYDEKLFLNAASECIDRCEE